MISRISLSFLALALLSLGALSLPNGAAQAQESPGMPTIAVVDVQMLLSDSNAAQSMEKQLEGFRNEFQKEISKHEDALRETEKKLTEERDTLSQEAFLEKREAFEEKLLEARQLVQKRKRSLDESYSRGVDVLRGKVIEIVAEVAETRGYKIVLSRQHVVIAEKSLDITSDVMKALNAAQPDIKLTIDSK